MIDPLDEYLEAAGITKPTPVKVQANRDTHRVVTAAPINPFKEQTGPTLNDRIRSARRIEPANTSDWSTWLQGTMPHRTRTMAVNEAAWQTVSALINNQPVPTFISHDQAFADDVDNAVSKLLGNAHSKLSGGRGAKR